MLSDDEILNRTVFATGFSKWYDENIIYKYFKRCGKIENFIFTKRDYALITFATAKQADKAIQNVKTGYPVLPARDWHKSLIEPYSNDEYNESQPSPLLSLNFDCSLKICKYLDLFDLIDLSKTCTTMKTFVYEQVFPRYKTIEVIYSSSKIDFFLIRNCNHNDMMMKRRLRAYDFKRLYQNFIMEMILKHLHNLQELHLESMDTIDCVKILDQLKVLTLTRCSNVGDRIILAAPNIIELNVHNSSAFNDTSFRNLRHLERLSIKYTDANIQKVLFCLNQNTQLTHLTLIEFSGINELSHFYSTISNLKSLQYIKTNFLNGWPFEHLPSLKSLCLSCQIDHGNVQSLKSLADMDQLEELNISDCSIHANQRSVFESYLLKFTKIRHFYVNDFMSETLLLQLAIRLNLTSLSCNDIGLSDDAAVKIVELNKNLKYFGYFLSTLTIRRIIKIIENDPERPKLMIIADVDDESIKDFRKYSCVRVDNKRLRN